MSGGFFGGFSQGFDRAKARKEDSKLRSEENARQDKYLDVLQSMGAIPPVVPSGSGYDGTGTPPFIPMGDDELAGGAGNDTLDTSGGYGRAAPAGGGAGGDLTIAGLLRKHEGAGDPSTLFGHSQRGGRFDGVDVSKMTLAELREFSRPDGEYGQWVKGKVGRVATPMGFGQIVGTTMRNTAKAMGLPDDTVFDVNTQTAMVNHLAKQRLINAKSPAAKRAAMRAEWEGFKHVPDSQLDAAIANFEKNGYGLQPRALGAV
ncbi:hypothetical protein [Sulfitobacter sp. M23508]|uniref:hypothetical protein n=1 Tax=Sulfitobacter sp. M23508 TaxID=3368577 RepID=UPI0037451D47